MAEKRVPTQFLDLKTEDFGPRQEEAGARIRQVGRPPPTEFIQTHPERVRPEEEVLAELDHSQSTLSARSRRLARTAASMWTATWDFSVRLAVEARRALRDAGSGREIGRMITLDQDATLRLRADVRAPVVAELRAGARLVTYPEIDAAVGWMVARAETGELGYVEGALIASART